MEVYRSGKIVGSLNPYVLRKHRAAIFIETGTHQGGGILVALCVGFFREIHSMETDEGYYLSSSELYLGNDRVSIVKGSSRDELPKILKRINERAVIFLDAHSPDEKNPLFDELDVIAKHWVRSHCLMIDDRRMWGCEWPCWKDVTREKVVERVLAINPEYQITWEDSMNGPQDILVADIP